MCYVTLRIVNLSKDKLINVSLVIRIIVIIVVSLVIRIRYIVTVDNLLILIMCSCKKFI